MLLLSCNKISEIEHNSIVDKRNQKYLCLVNNALYIIEEKLFNGLYNLTLLNLVRNRKRKFHRNAFERLKKLKNLYLSENKLKEIDENIFKAQTNLVRI
jgi:Leucine-rich repeat (LRR) protein